MDYFRAIEAQKDKLRDVLIKKKIKEELLAFDQLANFTKPTRFPTDARSEFLANRAMGDWAEEILADAIRKAMPDYAAIHYGESDSISAGDEGFKEFFIQRLEAVHQYGKRPDLLIMPKDIQCEQDISSIKTPDLIDTVNQSTFSIEVRSSKFEALTYMAVRKEEHETTGKKPSQLAPNFTVKVEDLLIVYRWLSLHDCPQIYCQVFFDSVFAINFLDIFKIIASGKGFKIETPAKSQLKSTIMIPITSGTKVAKSIKLPNFEAETRVTRLGRHDAYVVPIGGEIELDSQALLSIASNAA